MNVSPKVSYAAYLEGIAAFKADASHLDNPYPDGGPLSSWWSVGYYSHLEGNNNWKIIGHAGLFRIA